MGPRLPPRGRRGPSEYVGEGSLPALIFGRTVACSGEFPPHCFVWEFVVPSSSLYSGPSVRGLVPLYVLYVGSGFVCTLLCIGLRLSSTSTTVSQCRGSRSRTFVCALQNSTRLDLATEAFTFYGGLEEPSGFPLPYVFVTCLLGRYR